MIFQALTEKGIFLARKTRPQQRRGLQSKQICPVASFSTQESHKLVVRISNRVPTNRRLPQTLIEAMRPKGKAIKTVQQLSSFLEPFHWVNPLDMQVAKCIYFIVQLQLCGRILAASLRLPKSFPAPSNSETFNVTQEKFLNYSKELEGCDLCCVMFE